MAPLFALSALPACLSSQHMPAWRRPIREALSPSDLPSQFFMNERAFVHDSKLCSKLYS